MKKGFFDRPGGLLLILLLFFSFYSSAQQTAVYEDPEANYRLGLELFNKEKYGAAQEIFNKLIEGVEEEHSEIKTNASYYSAICALELFNENAEYKLTEFIAHHPTSARIGRAYFQLGRLQFRERDYRKALSSFLEVNRFDLSPDERMEYNFKLGFAYMKKGETANAKKLLANVKNANNKYSIPATYYYGHLAFEEDNYDEALQEFEKIKDDRSFRRIIPYYLIHIYYYQEKYNRILETGPELYQDATHRRKSEIARIIGDAYYRNHEYEKALEYLEEYKRSTRHSLSREDNYQIGYAYFKIDNCEAAINHFQDVITVEDSLSQNAYYHLADCYLKTDQKKYAANAFLSAYKMDFDKDIKEDALFNYAKLSVEVASDPYNQSIKYLEKYIQDYPGSDRSTEAYDLLSQLYLSTRNFKAALQSIEGIKDKNLNLKKAYQKITYYRGVELFNGRQFKEAIELFKTANGYDYDKKISAEATYWMAEAFYRIQNYWGAMKYYRLFLKDANASKLPYYNTAYYNLGYTFFKRDDYSDAVDYFKRFLQNAPKNSKMANDAYLRLGDCYFINKRYNSAVEYYNEALQISLADEDYALYQQAMSYGALGDFNKKINSLDRLVKYQPKSPYVDDAIYEMATSYLIMNDNRNALSKFDKLVRQHPQSQYARKSLLKTGLIYYNNDQNKQAIQALKQVTEKYPNTAEAREALASMKNIYIDMNRVDEYLDYTSNLSFGQVTSSEQDSITYIAAENRYMNNNCEEALPSFNNYIEKFPNGAFLVNAHYYAADCELRNDSYVRALEHYEYITEQPANTFTENAVRKAAQISEQLKMYENAYGHYKSLEQLAESNTNINIALEGQMNNSFRINNYDHAIEAANKLLKNEKVTTEQTQRAHYILAKSYLAGGQMDKAAAEFAIVDKLTTNEQGAESKYYLAYIQFEKGNYETAENIIFELTEVYASYDYWVAKAFILLSDIYLKLDNSFQAKQTLQSIIENYSGEDLRDVARQNLRQIIADENAAMPADTVETEEF